jgi:hypothetical protein
MMARIDHVEKSIRRMEDKLDRLDWDPNGLATDTDRHPFIRLLNVSCDMSSGPQNSISTNTTFNADHEVQSIPLAPIDTLPSFLLSPRDCDPDSLLWNLFPPPPSTYSFCSLPSTDDQLVLVDHYFTYCHNQPYSILREMDFRNQFHEGKLESHLILAVIANSAKFTETNSPYLKYHKMASSFADAAWKAIVSECFLGPQKVEIVTVQTLTLLAIFDFTGVSI